MKEVTKVGKIYGDFGEYKKFKTQIDILGKILMMKEEEIFPFIIKELQKHKYTNIIETTHYIMAEGDIPVGLVAHKDTVFNPPTKLYFDGEEGTLFSSPYEGLGADDRAGIFGIISLLARGLKPTIIVTANEEKGGLGARHLANDYSTSPWKLNYLIELDRQGELDSVYYGCANTTFMNYINSFGFKTAAGSYSDITFICPQWGIAGVNLSVGYQEEHTYNEFLDFVSLCYNLSKIKNILASDGINQYFHYIKSSTMTCPMCGKTITETDCVPVVQQDGTIIKRCVDCFIQLDETLEEHHDWCKKCNNLYVPGHPSFCINCLKEKEN